MAYSCTNCGDEADGSEIKGEPACAECVQDLRDRAFWGHHGGQR